MTKYLYGAAVQGIQGFIFQTNELKDIIGASELVEEICTDTCNDLIAKSTAIYTRAAGKIRCEFATKSDCEELVKIFPKTVSEKAPGVTLSQAVVKYEDENGYKKASQALEDALRVQRNIPMNSINIGLMGIKRSPQTGLPVIYGTGGLDDATNKKKKACDDARLKLMDDLYSKVDESKRPKSANIGRLTGLNDWIAMVHIDGNGLGQVFEQLGYDAAKCKKFSSDLDKATKEAAATAVKNISKKFNEEFYRIPILPVVLSGDDFTFICRASIAVDFVKEFLSLFEAETKEICKNGLTACGGIAFMKSSYPYYYAYDLAETLCGEAKTKSERKASCLMFHKIQDSFVEEWKAIEERELTPQKGLSFKYGPYYAEDSLKDRPTIKGLLDNVNKLDSKEGNAIKSHIRQWMTELHKSKSKAIQKANRVSSLLLNGDMKTLFDDTTLWKNDNATEFPAYDLLSLASVKFQDTKSEED